MLTIIAGSQAPGLTEEVLTAVAATLMRLDAAQDGVRWLARPVACEIEFSGADPDLVDRAVRDSLNEQPIDLAVQPAEGRRKRLLLADLESTIITRELTDELGALAGIGPRIAAITARAMRGEIDFAASLRERIGLLAGQPTALLDAVRERLELTAGARTLVQTMRANGAYTALVSGGFDCFAKPAAAACGFDEVRANQLLLRENRLTGQVAEPILGPEGKLAALKALAAERGLPLESTAAVGDGANDIPMLQSAGLGIAFHGKPAVAATARIRLDHADLTGMLYLQGYRSEEFRH